MGKMRYAVRREIEYAIQKVSSNKLYEPIVEGDVLRAQYDYRNATRAWLITHSAACTDQAQCAWGRPPS